MYLDDIKEFSLHFLFFAVLLVVAVIAPTALSVNAYSSWRCDQYEEMTGRDTQFLWFDDCYIKASENWLRADEYTATITAREGLNANQVRIGIEAPKDVIILRDELLGAGRQEKKNAS